MSQSILLTSFDIWKPHHVSNSSDDLVAELLNRNLMPAHAHCLRKLPVDFQSAPETVISKIDELQPEMVICCGMAEQRRLLTVESNGYYKGETIPTTVDVEGLVKSLTVSSVSHDAGQFVCNFLYYSVLKHLQENHPDRQCLFVHVPVLNESNLELILEDFLAILQQVG